MIRVKSAFKELRSQIVRNDIYVLFVKNYISFS